MMSFDASDADAPSLSATARILLKMDALKRIFFHMPIVCCADLTEHLNESIQYYSDLFHMMNTKSEHTMCVPLRAIVFALARKVVDDTPEAISAKNGLRYIADLCVQPIGTIDESTHHLTNYLDALSAIDKLHGPYDPKMSAYMGPCADVVTAITKLFPMVSLPRPKLTSEERRLTLIHPRINPCVINVDMVLSDLEHAMEWNSCSMFMNREEYAKHTCGVPFSSAVYFAGDRIFDGNDYDGRCILREMRTNNQNIAPLFGMSPTTATSLSENKYTKYAWDSVESDVYQILHILLRIRSECVM